MKFAAVLFVLGSLCLTAPLRAVEYFVATTGNDTNDGRSAATPYRNVARAASVVNPGDTVTVAAGTYTETFALIRSGTASASIVYRSITRGGAKIIGAVSIRSSYVDFSGFDVANPNSHGVNIVGHHVRLLGNDIHDCSGNGINGFACDYLTIEGNRLFRNGLENTTSASGLFLFQSLAFDQAPGFHVIIRGNHLFDNESRLNTRNNNFTLGIGIFLSDFRNTLEGSTAGAYRPATLVENNILSNNVGRAVVISKTDNVVVRNNTAWNNLRVRNTTASVSALGSFSCAETDGIRWVNNIVVARGSPDLAIFDSNTSNTLWDYNIFWNGGITVTDGSESMMGAHTYLADPRLIAPDTGNFRPSGGSPAVDAGNSAQAATNDLDRTARPIGVDVDIGAYEVVPDNSTPGGRAPTIAAQPVSQNSLAGELTTFSVLASGTAPLRYQWNRNGVAIAGATGVLFNLVSPQASDAGIYTVTVTSPAGSVTSSSVTLSVSSPPNFVWRNPTPIGGTLRAIAFAGGQFVAVGSGGRVLTSPDGATWTLTAILPTTGLTGLAHDGSQWVTVGNGVIFTSRDTVNWTRRLSGNGVNGTPFLSGVTYADFQFVAVSGDTVTTSRNGADWVQRSMGNGVSVSAVAGTTGRLVAVGRAGAVLTSTDAANWTRVPLPGVTLDFAAISFLAGQFIAVGSAGLVYSSADGVTWTDRSSPANGMWFNAIGQLGAQVVMVGYSDQAVVTSNLINYNRITIPFNSSAPRWSLASGGGQIVTVGSGGEIASSSDLQTWTQRGSNGGNTEQRGVVFLNTQWIAMSNAGVWTSPDAVTWIRRTTTQSINHATYANGRYYAVGDSGYIMSSPDAVTWVGGTTASGTTQNLRGIAFLGGRFVTVGLGGVIRTSTDGNTWTAVDSGITANLNFVTTFNDRFVLVGDNGLIRTSTNGTAWIGTTSGTTQHLRGIGSDGRVLLVSGDNRTVLASTDLQSWTIRSGPSGDNNSYRGIAAANGGWIAVGDRGTAAFSVDGVKWSMMPLQGFGESFLAVASNGLSTVAVGAGGTIMQADSPSLVPSRLVNVATRGLVQPGGELTPGFVLRGTGNKNVVVRAIGPTLSSFGLTGLSDVKLDVVNQQTRTTAAANDDWGGSTTLANLFASLGAFPLAASSRDAAVLTSLPVNQGGYSVRIAASGAGTSGVALAEVYDADNDDSPARLINVSTLGFVGTGDNVLTPGFVIRGSVPKLVLIRAIGPGLAQLGVGGLLADPQLSLFRAGSSVAAMTNNDWGGTVSLKTAFAAAGAFSIPDNSRDAALIATLPPGAYTAVVSGVGNTTGTALVEVYDLDP